jgi:hypothetical protein
MYIEKKKSTSQLVLDGCWQMRLINDRKYVERPLNVLRIRNDSSLLLGYGYVIPVGWSSSGRIGLRPVRGVVFGVCREGVCLRRKNQGDRLRS